MADLKKLSIETGDDGLLTVKGDDIQLSTTRGNLVDALVDSLDGDEIFAKYQEKKLEKKKEQYEKLKPIGFEYAPKSAKERWEDYKNIGNLEKGQWIYDNVSYNTDATMNIIKINKIFCEDISWQNKEFTWEQAQELGKTNVGGYKLMSDYNDCDVDKKEQTDRYKVINVFSNGDGDTAEGMELFRDMAGCNDKYWTSTSYKDENGTEVKGVGCQRELDEDGCCRYGSSKKYYPTRVCGFKDSM